VPLVKDVLVLYFPVLYYTYIIPLLQVCSRNKKIFPLIPNVSHLGHWHGVQCVTIAFHENMLFQIKRIINCECICNEGQFYILMVRILKV
jgi:hypothetical protein